MKIAVRTTLGLVVFFLAVVPRLSGNDGVFRPGVGKIVAGPSLYQAKSHKAWLKKGRLVGVAKNAPKFSLQILNEKRRVIREVEPEEGKDGSRVYEVWLKPGKYIAVFEAKGYNPLEVKFLAVRKGHDLRTDLEFVPAGK